MCHLRLEQVGLNRWCLIKVSTCEDSACKVAVEADQELLVLGNLHLLYLLQPLLLTTMASKHDLRGLHLSL